MAELIESEWAAEIAQHFGRSEIEVFDKIRPWFDCNLSLVRIELMDESAVEFRSSFFIVSETKRAIVVFTEHCGHHVFPYHEAKIFVNGKLQYEQINAGI